MIIRTVSKDRKLLITLLLICFVNINGYSQVDTTKTSYFKLSIEEILNLDVISASKSTEKSSKAPATIYVINEEQIILRGYTCLEEVLEDIPEIEIQKKASVEYSNYFTIRGIDGSEKFIIMLDGMRINSATGTILPIVHNYPVADAKQIEIILGPGSALYGSDAFTGIINIISKKGYETKGLRVNTSYGLFNTTDNSVVYGFGNEKVSVMVSGSFYHSEEPFMPEIYSKEYSWYNNNYSTNGELLLSPYSNETVVVPVQAYATPTNAYALHAKFNVDNLEVGYFRNYESHSSSISSKPEYTIYGKDELFIETVESMYTKYHFETSDKKWNFQTILSYSKDEIDPETHYINTFTSYEKGYKYGYNKSLRFEDQVKVQLFKSINLTGGVFFEDLTSLAKTSDLPFAFDKDVAANIQNLYYLGTNILDSAGNDLSIYQDLYYLQYRNYGTFLQLQSNLTNTLRLTLGARLDYNTHYGYTLNPRAGLVYSPVETFRIKLLYGKAYLQPSPYRAYQHYGSFIPVVDSISGEVTGLTSNYWRLPDKNLKPQHISTYEINMAFLPHSNLAFSINAFYNDVKDIVSSEGFTGHTFHNIPVTYVEYPINRGTSKSYGGTGKIDFRTNFRNSELNSYLAYTYIDGKIGDGHLSYTAQNTIKAGIDFKYKRISLSPRLIYRSASKHRNLEDEQGNIITNDPFTLINFTFRYSFLKKEKVKSDIFLKATNLMNSKFYNLPIGGRESFYNVPQDPIRVNLGVDVRF